MTGIAQRPARPAERALGGGGLPVRLRARDGSGAGPAGAPAEPGAPAAPAGAAR